MKEEKKQFQIRKGKENKYNFVRKRAYFKDQMVKTTTKQGILIEFVLFTAA